MRDARSRQELAEWFTVETFALFVTLRITPYVVFGMQAGARSLVLIAVVAGATLALILRRTGAWWLLLGLCTLALASFAWDWTGAIPFAATLVPYLLLVSRPMRRFVNRGAVSPRPVS